MNESVNTGRQPALEESVCRLFVIAIPVSWVKSRQQQRTDNRHVLNTNQGAVAQWSEQGTHNAALTRHHLYRNGLNWTFLR